MDARAAALSLKLSVAARGTKQLYSELLHNERLPRDELTRLADARAVEMAAFAYDHSPFYRDLYGDAGLSRADLRDPEAFSSLPVIDRSMVQENQALIRSSEATEANMRACNTAGSTGNALRTYDDARVPVRALGWRMFRWWGIAPSDDVAHIGRWGMSRRAKLAAQVARWPSRVLQMDVGLLDDAAIEGFVAQVNAMRPRLVEGYLHVLHDIARHVDREGLSFHSAGRVGCHGGRPHDGRTAASSRRRWVHRSTTRTAARRSRGWPGSAAERDGLHVFADMRQDRGRRQRGERRRVAPGTTGELVVTDLSNRVFPLGAVLAGRPGLTARRGMPLRRDPAADGSAGRPGERLDPASRTVPSWRVAC